MTVKILIDARMYGLENSGIGRYLINLTEELKNIETEEQFVILLRKKYFDKLNFPKSWKKLLADFRHYTFEEQYKLPGIIYKEKPDIVHFPHINYPILYRGKCVITVHDLTMQYQGLNATKLPLPIYYLKRFPFLFTTKIGIKTASAIIVPSKAVMKDVSSYYKINKNKIFIIYEGVDFGKFENHLRGDPKGLLGRWSLEKEKYFFYVGNAYPHKNLYKAIEAIVSLNKGNKEKVIFAIVGSKDFFKKRFEEYTKSIRAEKYIKLLGYVPDEDLRILYKNSAAFIYPSLSEGFGLQGLEAMASESLVIASDIPVFKEIYGDNAVYFNSNDVDSLVKVMKTVMKMSNEEKYKKVDEAKEFIKRYSWQKMAKETLNIYKQVSGN